jgi:hypothetical protein
MMDIYFTRNNLSGEQFVAVALYLSASASVYIRSSSPIEPFISLPPPPTVQHHPVMVCKKCESVSFIFITHTCKVCD